MLGNRDHAEMRHALLWEVMDNSPPEQRRDWNQDIFDLYAKNALESDAKWREVSKKRLRNSKTSLRRSAYPGTLPQPCQW